MPTPTPSGKQHARVVREGKRSVLVCAVCAVRAVYADKAAATAARAAHVRTAVHRSSLRAARRE